MTDEPASAGAAAAPRTIVMAWWVQGTTFKNRSHRYAPQGGEEIKSRGIIGYFPFCQNEPNIAEEVHNQKSQIFEAPKGVRLSFVRDHLAIIRQASRRGQLNRAAELCDRAQRGGDRVAQRVVG
jgi:hypothetical protein